MAKDCLQSPFRSPHPAPRRDGDPRDTHDHNPSNNLTHPREYGRAGAEDHFIEGENKIGAEVGRVADITPDILSTAMGGQRRSATGEYESQPSIHCLQKQERDELEARLQQDKEQALSKRLGPWPLTPGRE